MVTHFSILDWRTLWTEESAGVTVHRITKSRTRLSDFHFTLHQYFKCHTMITTVYDYIDVEECFSDT